MAKKNTSIKINKRNLEVNSNIVKTEEQTVIDYYNSLKEKLSLNIKKEIYNKIDTMKILKEIRDNEYYKIDGYKKFSEFLNVYKLAKTQAYEYLKLADNLLSGKITEEFIIDNGINESIALLKNKNLITTNQNPLKPLRFQLRDETAYKYYKEHMKFTSWLLEKIFKERPQLIKEFEEEYKIEK